MIVSHNAKMLEMRLRRDPAQVGATIATYHSSKAEPGGAAGNEFIMPPNRFILKGRAR